MSLGQATFVKDKTKAGNAALRRYSEPGPCTTGGESLVSFVSTSSQRYRLTKPESSRRNISVSAGRNDNELPSQVNSLFSESMNPTSRLGFLVQGPSNRISRRGGHFGELMTRYVGGAPGASARIISRTSALIIMSIPPTCYCMSRENLRRAS